jgi:MYXO-CTERM domain-containing protein
MANSCGGQAVHPIRGVELVGANGVAVQRWGDSESWSGRFWGNATHGFVWDAADATLSTFPWSSGVVSSTRLPVLANATYQPYAGSAPELDGDRLFLFGPDGATFIDPNGPRAQTVLSPFKDGFTLLEGDGLAFGKWAEGNLSFAHATLDGDLLWQASAHGTDSYWNAHSLVVYDPNAHRVGRWVDGQAVAAIELGAGGAAVLSGQGDRLAIGIRGSDERLLVFGEDQAQILAFDADDARAVEPIDTSTSTWTGPEAHSTSSAGGATNPAPIGPAAFLALAAAVALAARRRIA